MCTSRLRQRPTTGRLHHVRWLLAVSTRELRNVSNPVARGPLPRPEDRSTGQATRTSRRTRAMLSEGRVTSHSARTGDVATTTGAARPWLPSASSPPPVPARRCCPTVHGRRCTAHSPADRESVAECGAHRDRRGILPGRRRIRPHGPHGAPVRTARSERTRVSARTANRGTPVPRTPVLRSWPPQLPGTGPLRKHPGVIQHAHGRAERRASIFLELSRGSTEPQQNPEHAVCRAGARTQRAGSTPPARPPHGSNTQPAGGQQALGTGAARRLAACGRQPARLLHAA